MANIKENSHQSMLKCYENDGQIRVEYLNGSFETINKAHGRFYFSSDNLKVTVLDGLFNIRYKCLVANLENDTAKIGDIDAVIAHLSKFVGV